MDVQRRGIIFLQLCFLKFATQNIIATTARKIAPLAPALGGWDETNNATHIQERWVERWGEGHENKFALSYFLLFIFHNITIMFYTSTLWFYSRCFFGYFLCHDWPP
jgi:hypothetical protein